MIKQREDIFIPAEEMNGGLHGDRVIVRITSRGEIGKKKKKEKLLRY